jgi:hypothetical protein
MTTILSTTQQADIANHINKYRVMHQAPPLSWDNTITAFSQQWASHLLSIQTLIHSGNPLYGENLAFLQGYGTNMVALIKQSIDLWYNEVSKYNFAKPGFSSETGHFTCLVWKSSTKFGIGYSIDAKSNSVYITMNTSPPGNYIGEFQDNVFPSLNAPVPAPAPAPVPAPVPTPLPTTTLSKAKQDIITKLYTLLADVRNRKASYILMNEIVNVIALIHAL